jgi:hypothetical protein
MAVDIRKPKPFHSAREFFSEMLSVTVGILIALSLEALIDQYRTDRLIDYARDDFRFELQGNRDKLTGDLQKARQTEASLRTLVEAGRILLKHQPLPATMNLGLSRSFVELRSAAWTSALSTQVMGHFPPREARALAEAYSEQEAFTSAEQAAQQQWFSLSGYVDDAKDLTDDQLRQGLHEAAEGFAYLETLEDSESRLLGTYDETLKMLGQ